MQILNCATCDTAPLGPPRLIAGAWYALCTGCLADNPLEPDNQNVFLPMRFRVVIKPSATRRPERGDTPAQTSA